MSRFVHNIITIGTLLFTFTVNCQDTLYLDEVEVNKRRFELKRQGLYEGEVQEQFNIKGFTQVDIFSGSLSDFWTSENLACVEANLNSNKGQAALNVKWNADNDQCDWVGMGFGWDGWKAKDMAYVLDTMAIELSVRSTGEPFTNIPWAFCFEDYSGGQAWLGYNKNFLQEKEINSKWTKVILPLELFPFEENEVDATSIKQFMIQIFAEGELEIGEIKCIPYRGKQKFQGTARQFSPTIDANLTDWKESTFQKLEDGSEFALSYDAERLYFSVRVNDTSPRQNPHTAENLWKGDAVEIAFSTNSNANTKRKFLLLSDQHIGINCGKSPYVWNWKTNSKVRGAEMKINNTEEGYIVELAIPFSAFRNFQIKEGVSLDLEVAIDFGKNGEREKQIRWNSMSSEGFHLTPQLWGKYSFQ